MAHLCGRLQVELFALEPQTVRIVAAAARLHAQERVVRFGVGTVRVVTVVRREQADLELPGDAKQPWVHTLLLGETMVLELDEERVAAEHVTEPRRQVACRRVVVASQRLAHRAPEAPARRDDAAPWRSRRSKSMRGL